MDKKLDRALLLEALSEKVLHQLPPAVWKGLFLGSERASIRFEERRLTLVQVEVDEPGGVPEHFYQALRRLSSRHHGRLDPCVNATALATFEDADAAARMALDLQRAAEGVALRIGVASGPCTLAFFRVRGRLWCTPLGAHTQRVAEVAAGAAPGSIVISPETGEPQSTRRGSGDAPDFADSELDLSSLQSCAMAEGMATMSGERA